MTKPKPARIVIVAEPELTDDQIMRALATDIPGVPCFQAFVQMIGKLERVAIDSMPGLVNQHGALASEAGGVQILSELRDKLFEFRARGQRGENLQVQS